MTRKAELSRHSPYLPGLRGPLLVVNLPWVGDLCERSNYVVDVIRHFFIRKRKLRGQRVIRLGAGQEECPLMKRYLPRVECLEERCVPDADPIVQVAATSEVALSPTLTSDQESYVIDPYLIDPNTAVDPKPIAPDQTMPVPDSAWQLPESPVPPIDNPFWY